MKLDERIFDEIVLIDNTKDILIDPEGVEINIDFAYSELMRPYIEERVKNNYKNWKTMSEEEFDECCLIESDNVCLERQIEMAMLSKKSVLYLALKKWYNHQQKKLEDEINNYQENYFFGNDNYCYFEVTRQDKKAIADKDLLGGNGSGKIAKTLISYINSID